MENNSTRIHSSHHASRRAFLRTLGAGVVGFVAGGAAVSGISAAWQTTQQGVPPLPLNGRFIDPVSITLDSGITIHSVQTGYVSVKTVHREYDGVDGTGFPAIFASRTWTEWLPISAWVIEHPEGVIVVDTGETARINEPGYTDCDPVTNLIYSGLLRFALSREDEIGAQLPLLGISPSDVRWVVQTHLHGDHVGGLAAFPRAEFLLSEADYRNPIGGLTCRYPANFNPTLVDHVTPTPLTGFPNGYALTQAGDVWIIPTPGHTAGHQSVVLLSGDKAYCFAGDASFSQAQVMGERVPGIALQPAENRITFTRLIQLATDIPLIYLPTHDPETRARLLAATPLV